MKQNCQSYITNSSTITKTNHQGSDICTLLSTEACFWVFDRFIHIAYFNKFDSYLQHTYNKSKSELLYITQKRLVELFKHCNCNGTHIGLIEYDLTVLQVL